ncbi:DUF503 domain-containing protein [Armatimonas sp.]|uniref:DUF503 domain-containing protein n=1 Tax=Armatimonas sp. TaxID=1872638 RepID=UPI00286C77F3|nr:DUF503 domain-containing protein [Armatimonas sp.]
MHIGVLTLCLSIGYADSLKDKRQAVKSLVARVRNKFNVSIAEVDELDIWRRATLGVTVVSNSALLANQILQKVIDYVDNDANVVLDDYGIEML